MTDSILDFLDEWEVIQAAGHGVEISQLSTVAPTGWLTFLRPPRYVNRYMALSFANRQVGDSYGFLTLLSIALGILPPHWFRWPLQFRENRTWICSALVGESLRYAGWQHTWPDIYQTSPASLYHALIDSGAEELDVLNSLDKLQPGDIGFCHSVGLVGWAIRAAQHRAGWKNWTVNHAFFLYRKDPLQQSCCRTVVCSDPVRVDAEHHGGGVTGPRRSGGRVYAVPHQNGLVKVPERVRVGVDPQPGCEITELFADPDGCKRRHPSVVGQEVAFTISEETERLIREAQRSRLVALR